MLAQFCVIACADRTYISIFISYHVKLGSFSIRIKNITLCIVVSFLFFRNVIRRTRNTERECSTKTFIRESSFLCRRTIFLISLRLKYSLWNSIKDKILPFLAHSDGKRRHCRVEISFGMNKKRAKILESFLNVQYLRMPRRIRSLKHTHLKPPRLFGLSLIAAVVGTSKTQPV